MSERSVPSSTSIYEDMRKRLVSAAFEPGQKLQPEAFRRTYDCAASTMREVFFRLATDRLVDFEEKKGFRVTKPTRSELVELTHLRVMIEIEGARLSILNGDLGWEANLAAAHHKLAHIESKARSLGTVKPIIDLWCEAEWEFHDRLTCACGSETLRATHRWAYDRFRQHAIRKEDEYGFRQNSEQEHLKILEAAMARDIPLITLALKQHLEPNLGSNSSPLKHAG